MDLRCSNMTSVYRKDVKTPSTQHNSVEHHQILPRSAYNYQPYIPPPAPPILPWSRTQIYAQIAAPNPPVFLTCNLANPIHLASILAPGCDWSGVESVAAHMTPGKVLVGEEGGETAKVYGKEHPLEGRRDRNADDSDGVLVGGLSASACEALEAVFQRRGCKRHVERVSVLTHDGGVVVLPAYVYQTTSQKAVDVPKL